ncbi:uncharacterized protein LOC117663984 isoform X3 [Pantherophis guttatus]|uniref:Uncharacterized protein LOC117663984 isoform X3 n=1 Tax=Pantherophis guttatus TaxID=94885 RepID=A0A6P9BGY1_PANGU|nr:uncharacterized protein LOC117663984 isoform X3 [Pantherophis guttatus]
MLLDLLRCLLPALEGLPSRGVRKRAWVLQFFRNLFGGSRHVTQEGEKPTAGVKEKDDIKSELLDCALSDTEVAIPSQEPSVPKMTSSEICPVVMSSPTEELSLMKEATLGDTALKDENNVSALFNSTRMDLGDTAPFAESMLSNNERVSAAGEEDHNSSDRGTLGKHEITPVTYAEDGVSMAAGSMADIKDCNVEDETEHLLKEDVQKESPKSELSPWNRLINMYKQRRRLPASKVANNSYLQIPLWLPIQSNVQIIPTQPVTEDEATLDLMIYGIANPSATTSSSPKAFCILELPENEIREMADDHEIACQDTGSNGSPKHFQSML